MSAKTRKTYAFDNAMTNLINSFETLHDGEFLQGAKAFYEKLKEKRYLPSKHQIGDKVIMNFYGSGRIEDCEVLKVHFTEGSVSYDLEISGLYDESYQEPGKEPKKWHTRVYNVEASFVTAE